MKKKIKVLTILAAIAIVVAVAAYLKYPVSPKAPWGKLTGDNKPAQNAPATPVAKVDAAVDAIVQGYDQDQAVAQQEDSDATYVSQDSAKINSLSGVYNENNF